MRKLLLIAILLLLPKSSFAARLYFDPAEGTFGPGDDVEVNVRLDVGDSCVNTIEAEIDFPGDYLYVRDFFTGDSILSIWLSKPSQGDFDEISNKGKLYFAGGIPGGYCGRIPGDPGDSNIVGKMVFTIPSLVVSDVERKTIEIKFTDRTQVLKNDGQGTADALFKEAAVFQISGKRENADYSWLTQIENDTIPPEPFVIELRRSENMFDGAYHLIFSTVDKQTGLDHFEVLELKTGEQIGIRPKTNFWEKLKKGEKPAPNWIVAQMPYRLNDQSLSSVVKVKAVDKAGNERIVEYIPPKADVVVSPDNATSNRLVIVISSIIGVLVVVAVALGLFFYKKKKIIAAGKKDRTE